MNRWKIKYTDLLTVSVLQPFYTNNVYAGVAGEPVADILFVPAAETQLLMKRLDLVYKQLPRKGGFIVAAGTNEKAGVNYLRFHNRKGDKLTFFMILNNAAFLNFNTVPSAVEKNKAYYFTNKITGNPAARIDPLYLTSLNTGMADDADRVKLSGTSYAYHFPGVVANASVKHILTNKTIAASSMNNAGGSCDLAFDLSALPPGKCTLIVNGSDTETFYHTGAGAPASILGVIELDLADTLDSNYRLVETDHSLQATAPFYFLQFGNRKTTWRYTFKLTPASPLYNEIAALVLPDTRATFLADLTIVSNDPGITFTQTSPDEFTVIFTSDNPLSLKEKYTVAPGNDALQLALTKYTSDLPRKAVVRDHLPYPPVNIIDARNPSFIYSDIFLTL